jgi:hypothetical protein
MNIFFVHAQQSVTTASANNRDRLVPMDTLCPEIEAFHRVKVYYNPQWFGNKVFRESIAARPLDECLAIIRRLTDLDCILLEPDMYVFVPPQLRNYSNRKDVKGILVVGEDNKAETPKEVQLGGRIVNAKTGSPLAGAKLSVDKLNLSCTTDKKGQYRLAIPPGEYDVRLYYPGLKEDIQVVRVKGSGMVDFEMAESTILLKEVLVVGNPIDFNVSRAQMSAVRLTAKMIKEMPLILGEKDIVKSVAMLPGVQSTGEFGTGYFVRGGGSDQNLLLLEEVPLFNSSHVFGVSSAVNADGVNSVSFIKAGIPARYGERASSVMDIRFDNNFDKFSLKGGVGLLDSRLNLEVPLLHKKVFWQVSARSSYSDWLLHAMPDNDLKKSSAGFYDLNSLLNIRLTPQDNVSLFGYFSNDRFSFTPQNPYRYDNTLASIRYRHIFNDKLSAGFMAGMSRYRNSQSERDTLQPTTAYRFSSSIRYYNTKLNVAWTPNDRHSFEAGINGVFYYIRPGKLTPYDSLSTIGESKINSEKGIEMAAYLSDNWSITPGISIDWGARFTRYACLGPGDVPLFKPDAPSTADNIESVRHYGNNASIQQYSSFEPRLSARYLIDKNSSVKASYNRISQFINLISNTAVMSPSDVYKLSSPNIKPLICNQIALGYFRNFQNNSIETSIELYYKHLDNIIDYRNGASIFMNNLLEADLLNASGYNYGAELYVRKNTGKLTGWISYTYSRSMRHTTSPYPEDRINDNRYYPSSFDKPNNLVVSANYHLTRRWWVSGTFTYRTGQPVTLPEYKYTFQGKQYIYYSDRNKYRLEDYNRLDIAITHEENLKLKRGWKSSWTFAIINVYGQKNPYSVYYKNSSKISQTFNLYELFIIARPIPTLTYNFSF